MVVDFIERSFYNALEPQIATSVPKFSALAFVDIETTGLSPTENRVAEIGIITVNADRVERWTTLIKSPGHRELDSAVDSQVVDEHEHAPTFADVAPDLARRLSGRLFVAHNARFDYSFLRAEFERAGIAFESQVVCSVMLSRHLYPHLQHHNLDALAESHRLVVDVRHRALPDADLLWQWWQVIHRELAPKRINRTIGRLLAGPLLPPQLDPSLIDRLPKTPGAYVLIDEEDRPLAVGAAANLKLHLANYFRLDRATAQALEYAHRVTHISWQATRGLIGARLCAAERHALLFTGAQRRLDIPAYTWRFRPDTVPCIEISAIGEASWRVQDSYGLFPTERKARNALLRLAIKHHLCHELLGLGSATESDCRGRAITQSAGCSGEVSRKKELMRILDALRPLRVPAWPYHGPVGIRERSDVHVVDQWQFLGTARSDGDLHAILEGRPREFDPRTYRVLRRTLSQLPQRKIVDLERYTRHSRSSAPMAAETSLGAPSISVTDR
jgi:DNA polymerase III subunit epsilon